MMKSTITLAIILFTGALFASCTKDILPDPATANASLGNQTQIYAQSFNTAYPNWPAGWSSSSTNGWVMDTSAANNSATGAGEGTYTGASGGAMTEVSDPLTSSGDGAYTMTTGSISTVGYSNISVIWGARNSKHFADSGSYITFQWSGDGGNTWNNVVFSQNTNNSDWGEINGGDRIELPAAAAGSSGIIFQWTAYLFANSSGTYRIDDFWVYGTPN